MKFRYLAFAILALSACKEESQKQTVQAIPVEVIATKPVDVPLFLEFSGRAQGSKEVEVRSQVSGILLKRNYIEGAEVKEGDVLFKIDPAPYQATLKQTQAKLAQEQAKLEAAKNQFRRMNILFKDRIVSEKALDDAKTTLETVEASIELARAEVQSAQLDLDYTTVTAPISGITSLETKSEGSLISNTDLLTNITQLNPVYVMFSSTDKEIFGLRDMFEHGFINNPRKSDKNTMIAKIKFDNGAFYEEEGEITFTNSIVDTKTGTVQSRAVFANPTKKIMPGQFARVVIEGITRLNAIVLPKESVLQGSQGSFVYRVNADNIAEIVNVKTGLSAPNGDWIIDEGLNEGDKIVVDGIMKVRPNALVQIKN